MLREKSPAPSVTIVNPGHECNFLFARLNAVVAIYAFAHDGPRSWLTAIFPEVIIPVRRIPEC